MMVDDTLIRPFWYRKKKTFLSCHVGKWPGFVGQPSETIKTSKGVL